MALTLMLCGASDSAMQRVRLFMPPLDALYAAMVGIAITPLTEDMVMMEPPRPCDQQQQGMQQSTQHGRKHSTAA
jgi:hypothetical protein